MGYLIWRDGAWRRLDACSGLLEGYGNVQFVFVSGGCLRVAPRRAVLRLLQGRLLRRADKLPSAPTSRHPLHRGLSDWPPCCHAAAATCMLPWRQLQQPVLQSTFEPNIKTEQPLQTEQQNNQLQTEQQNRRLQTEQQNNRLPTEQQSNQPQSSSDNSSRETPCKELILDYGDVKCIKNYLEKNPQVFGSIDCELFREDEGYRSGVLFRFQPLVKLRRLSDAHKYQFAANLGLEHVGDRDVTPLLQQPQNSKTTNSKQNNLFGKRSNKENARVENAMRESETGMDSEGSSWEPANRKRVSQSEIDNLLNEPKHLRSNTSAVQMSPRRVRERDGDRGSPRLGRARERDQHSGSATTARDKAASYHTKFFSKDRSAARSRRVAKPASYKTGNTREYSSLEDHVIVSWLHNGSRSRLVNGNRLWRELQEAYSKLTGGQRRSWQSLRNRYLRHILPALGTLRLEDHLQETLRANAAMGELKLRRKRSMTRRNSIFNDTKVESAWGRQPRTQGPREERPAAATARPARAQHTSITKEDSARKVPRRTRHNPDKHSSETDEFQPKPDPSPARLNAERTNNDIKRLAERIMRPTRGDSATKTATKRDQNVRQNVTSSTNKLFNATSNSSNNLNEPKNSNTVLTPHSVNANSVISNSVKTNSVNANSVKTNSVLTNHSVSKKSEAPNRDSSPRTVAQLASLFNARNMRSPRTLGASLYGSPNRSGSSAPQSRLSADKHIARVGEGGSKRGLYQHRAAP